MAMQTGVAASSKVLILVGAGLTGSIILRSGRLSEILSELQELMKGVNNIESAPGKFDSAQLTAQIRQLAQEIRELSISRPLTIYNGDSSSGGFASYIMPAAALGAMGYCYMWWKGWSLSDVMFVTKHNMANAVATVSKQLENVSEALASTKKHLAKRLETLDWKLDEQKEISNLIANDVHGVKSDLNQIGYDIDMIHQMVSGLEGKLDVLESKQDMTNTGLWHLCQLTGGVNDGTNPTLLKDVETKLIEDSKVSVVGNSLKGLQFLTEIDDPISVQKSTLSTKSNNFGKDDSAKIIPTVKTRIHRSYPVGLSMTRGMLDL